MKFDFNKIKNIFSSKGDKLAYYVCGGIILTGIVGGFITYFFLKDLLISIIIILVGLFIGIIAYFLINKYKSKNSNDYIEFSSAISNDINNNITLKESIKSNLNLLDNEQLKIALNEYVETDEIKLNDLSDEEKVLFNKIISISSTNQLNLNTKSIKQAKLKIDLEFLSNLTFTLYLLFYIYLMFKML